MSQFGTPLSLPLKRPRAGPSPRGYLSHHARRMEKYLDYKFANRVDVNLTAHTDNIYRMLKVFFYLNNITETNAPFSMWRRSQQRREWRRLPDYLQYIDHPYGRDGHIPKHIYSQLGSGENADVERVECTAAAGTAIFCDVSGLHSASLLREGYRLMLVDNWMTYDKNWLNPYHCKVTGPDGHV